jgi:ribosomal protein L37E
MVSIREYAKQRNISASYVSRLISQGKIPLHNGKIDPQEADSRRALFTRAGKGKRRWQRRHPTTAAKPAVGGPWQGSVQECSVCGQRHWVVPTKACAKCGRQYSPHYCEKHDNHNPDPATFCSATCAGVAPPKPLRRVCDQCGDPRGYSVEEARRFGDSEPDHFCEEECFRDFQAGKSRSETRARLLAHLREDEGYAVGEVKKSGWRWLLE